MSTDNVPLGNFNLENIPPSPRGVPQIEVTFDIDANGILNVTAKDKASGKEQKITIQNATQLTDEEVEKMKGDAEKFAEEDRKKKELAEARNQADTLIFTAEKSLKDTGGKVKDEDKKAVEEKIKNLKDLLAKEDATKEELEKATNELSENLQKIGSAMYEQVKKEEEGKKGEEKKPEAEKSKDTEEKAKAEEGEVVNE